MSDDQIYDMLSELAGLDTHDVNLRDNPKAYEIVGAYVEAAVKSERERCADICERLVRDNSDAGECADAIRALSSTPQQREE